ncbi:Hpt domain-containing protein [Roseovarius sp. CAU 1744]|uniref:Hpt domain-containing protein n=1 Tax=Roseovarius sp. CAU 1744 TaxID=3140368 RepID=UPI00325C14E5
MIDWDRVNELRDEIGADDFAEVVEIFLEEVEEEMAKLGVDADQQSLESTLHFLKGSALNLGFTHFSELCQASELAARANTPVDTDALKAAYAASKAEFLASLDKPDAA